jgi:TolB-like protein/DNA-binding winged helix-turn-helix (wHTH) protein/Tfp pilus assembly protein PilF
VGDPVSGFKIDDLLVDVGRARVTRGDQELPLTRLSFDLLLVLIDAAPNLVTADELLSRVWPGLIVGPETISQRVKLLRNALGDDARQPRYIAAVRGRGYRLIADPIPVPGAALPVAETGLPDATAPALVSLPVEPSPVSVWLKAGMAGVVLLGVVFLSFLSESLPEWRAGVAESAPPLQSAVAPSTVAVLRFRHLDTSAESEAFAVGLSEGVLHQLSGLRDVTAIARTSSLALAGGEDDARVVGKRLNAAYLVDGSVQSDRERLRVMVRLIDARSGVALWSKRFDRVREDIFTVQDEIATEVATSLELSLAPAAAARITGRETRNFEAYLAFMQARRLLGTLRVGELRKAVDYLERAIRLDPGFASAYVEQAAAVMQLAEYDRADDRREPFLAARTRAAALIDRALALNPSHGAAYVQRGFLHAFTDLARAEADFRHGIALAPNEPRGYEGLAATLFQDPERMHEARAALEQARRLEPLEPRYDVTMSVLHFYGFGRVGDAEASLVSALDKDPLYAPALMRLGELRWLTGGLAEAIRYGEQNLSIDPRSDWTRRYLMRAYLDLGEVDSARSLVEESRPERVDPEGADALPAVTSVPILLYEHNWLQAGEAAYSAVDAEAALPIDEEIVSSAIRMHARISGDTARALGVLERWSRTTQDTAGLPVSGEERGMRVITTALAEILALRGEAAGARHLMTTLLDDMEREASESERGDLWNFRSRPRALMLLDRPEEALAALVHYSSEGAVYSDHWLTFEVDPLFDGVRDDPKFQRLRAAARANQAVQAARVMQLRQEGVIPDRRSTQSE